MSSYSIDLLYVWAQLGVPPGARAAIVEEVVANARIYRFATRERIARVERLARFIEARGTFGSPHTPFEDIRKAYYRRAMELHPDLHAGDTATEEQLKILNATYESVEDIHIEAEEYFEKPESVRAALDNEARHDTAREAEAAVKSRHVHMSYTEAEARRESWQAEPPPQTRSQPQPRAAVKYMAASVPRYIRNRRLFYLGPSAIIGSKLVKSEGSIGLLYDVIMLPERKFMRARLDLGIEGSGSPALEMTNLVPAYVPIDTKIIVVPPDEADPGAFAKAHFMREYGLP